MPVLVSLTYFVAEVFNISKFAFSIITSFWVVWMEYISSVLWHCWSSDRNGIWYVKYLVQAVPNSPLGEIGPVKQKPTLIILWMELVFRMLYTVQPVSEWMHYYSHWLRSTAAPILRWVCHGVLCVWVGVWVGGCVQRKPLIRMTWSLAE